MSLFTNQWNFYLHLCNTGISMFFYSLVDDHRFLTNLK